MQAGERVGGRFLLTERLVPDNHARRRRVWLAHDELMGRDVVLKDVGDTPRAPGFAPGEIRALAKAGHPHVITVYEFVSVEGDGDHDGDWAVLEYAADDDLATTRLAPGQAAAIAAQIAAALAHLHDHGLVHGDVKPANIVRTQAGVAKLTDFGSAYRTDQTLTPATPISYTPGYAPPEVTTTSPRPVPASDVYSLAATTYALITGAPPQPDPADLDKLGPLGTVLAPMLRDEPTDRPDATHAQRQFQAVADGLEPDGPTAETIPTTTGPQVVPAQLPADVDGFAGRAAELDQLDRLIPTPTENQPTAVVITAVSGTAGVGKTALAVHWAHRIAHRYPDGQLYVNLRGFDPTGQTLTPTDAIRSFLDALGIPPDRIPADTNAQTGLYRSLLAHRRTLVILDNARDTHQILPLLPGAPGCLVLVTSRNDLVDLIVQHGARPLDLALLDKPDARQLLEHRLGTDRTAAEPDAVDAIITACAGLPLALAIVAAQAALRPRLPLATFATQLRDSHARLGALTGERPDTDARAVFSWSYTQLTPPAQRLFRLLGLHPGPDLSTPAAASLAGLPPTHTAALLTELTRTHLLTEHQPGRYTFHDLLHAYATELAHTTDTDTQRHTATARMLDHYLHTAYAANKLLRPQRTQITLANPTDGTTPERLLDRELAMGWFTTEHPVLFAALASAAAAGFDTHTWQLAWSLNTFLDWRGHWHNLIEAWYLALDAARRLGDREAEAQARSHLTMAYFRLDRYDDAHNHADHAVQLYRELGDRAKQGDALQVRARVYERQGRHADALDCDQHALHLYSETGERAGEAHALNGIGWDYSHLGQYETALAYCQQALDLFQELGDAFGEAATWDSLGNAHRRLHHFEDAATCYQRAVDLCRDLGDRVDEAATLDRLGDTQHAAGDPNAAARSWRAALAIFDELGHPDTNTVRTKLERLDRPSAPPPAAPSTPPP